MAQKVEVVLTCDLDAEATPAVETVGFSYEGQRFEFELCPTHLAEFQEVMSTYVAAARAASGSPAVSGRASRSTGSSGSGAPNPSEIGMIREWARNHGFDVSDRGRISAQVREAFEAAQR